MSIILLLASFLFQFQDCYLPFLWSVSDTDMHHNVWRWWLTPQVLDSCSGVAAHMLTESWSSERSKNQKDRTFVILTHGNQLKLKIHIMVLCPRVYIPGCHSLGRGSFINYTGQIRLRLEGSFVCSSRMDVSSGGGREWAGTVCIHKRTEETVVSNQQNGN